MTENKKRYSSKRPRSEDKSADRLLWTRSMLSCPNCCQEDAGFKLCDFHKRGLEILGINKREK